MKQSKHLASYQSLIYILWFYVNQEFVNLFNVYSFFRDKLLEPHYVVSIYWIIIIKLNI